MTKPKNQNKRLNKKITHIGGPIIDKNYDVPNVTDSVIPSEISDEEVRRRRAVRENREDIQAAFGTGY